jgi:hypothetical protein
MRATALQDVRVDANADNRLSGESTRAKPKSRQLAEYKPT